MDRRDEGREGAQPGDHHRLSGQRGGAGASARRLSCSPRVPANAPRDEYGERATQWFIVSDLGLTAYSGTDGIHAFVNSLASTAPVCRRRAQADRPQQRGARQQDHRRRRRASPSSLGCRAAKADWRRRCSSPRSPRGDYAFLSLKSSPFDLTDRGVAGRDAPTGLDAFVFTERGVYRTGETVHVTALLRDAA